MEGRSYNNCDGCLKLKKIIQVNSTQPSFHPGFLNVNLTVLATQIAIMVLFPIRKSYHDSYMCHILLCSS